MGVFVKIKLYLFVSVVFIQCYQHIDEGSYCEHLGLKGACRQVNACTAALNALHDKGYHNLKRCGFVGSEEVVCCPDIRDANRNPILSEEHFPTRDVTESLGVTDSSEFSVNRDKSKRKNGKGRKREGSSCEQLGLIGVCKKFYFCNVAVESIKYKGRHNLKRCGFNGTDEVVCCPELSDRNRNPSIAETSTVQNNIWTLSTLEVNKTDRISPTINKRKRKAQRVCEQNYIDFNIKPPLNFHIFNGRNASVGEFPHAAALGFENSDEEIEWKCGASLISPKFLLTAAHCFVCNGCSDPKKARLGVIDINNNDIAQDIDVKTATPHPSYNVVSKHNDIGLVELAYEVTTSEDRKIYPACLYTKDLDPRGLQIIGWGQTGNDKNSKSSILQYAVIEPVDLDRCNETIVSKNPISSKVILRSQICATTTSDACAGDSGGPLQILSRRGSYEIVGIVSYGVQCGTAIPGIYTRVYSYLDWIEQIVWPD